jgi:hypothetical protein
MKPTDLVRCPCGIGGEAAEVWAWFFLMPDGSFLCMDCWYARPQPKRKVA